MSTTILPHAATTIPGFNGQGTISLGELYRLTPQDFNDASFVKYAVLDLSEVDLENSEYWNIGTRAETCNRQQDIDDIRVSFRNYGFLTTEHPPAYDTDGVILGGRTRITAAIENGERFIPIALYSRSDTSLRNTVTNGLIENQKLPSNRSTFADFVHAGVVLIKKGQLGRDKKSIETWLYNEVQIEKVYDNSINGIITKIVKGVMKQSEPGDSLLFRRERKGWGDWIYNNLGYKTDEYELVSIDSESYADRLWVKVLENAKRGSSIPTKVILYTNEKTGTQAKNNLTSFQKRMSSLVVGTYSLVKRLHGVSFEASQESYKILGAVPQIVGVHDIEGKDLVSVSKY